MLAIWFCIAFLIYTDDTRRRASVQESSGFGASGNNGLNAGGGGGDPVALALKNGPISEEEEAAAFDAFAGNRNELEDVADRAAPQEADVPPTAKHKRVKVIPRQQAVDSLHRNVAAVVPVEDKTAHKQPPSKEDGKLSRHIN